MCSREEKPDDLVMKKPLVAAATALTAVGASFGLFAGTAAAGAPCPPHICQAIDNPVVRDTGIKPVVDAAWDRAMECANAISSGDLGPARDLRSGSAGGVAGDASGAWSSDHSGHSGSQTGSGAPLIQGTRDRVFTITDALSTAEAAIKSASCPV